MRTLAGIAAACLVLAAGCAEPGATESAATASAEPGTNASFEFIEDADLGSTLSSNPVVVVNFTADW